MSQSALPRISTQTCLLSSFDSILTVQSPSNHHERIRSVDFSVEAVKPCASPVYHSDRSRPTTSQARARENKVRPALCLLRTGLGKR